MGTKASVKNTALHAIITGGSSGIGFATARALLEQGFRITLAARNPDRLELARQALIKQVLARHTIAQQGQASAGHTLAPHGQPFGRHGQEFAERINVVPTDVAERDSVTRLFQASLSGHDTVDLVFHSAGVAYPDYFHEISQTHMREALDINLVGTWNVLSEATRVFETERNTRRHVEATPAYWEPTRSQPRQRKLSGLRRSTDQGWRHIVVVSSMAGLIPVFGYSAYGMTKFGVAGLALAVRQELRDRCINVSVLCPPDVDTPQLAQEAKTRPPETQAVAGNRNPVDPEVVAEYTVRRLPRCPALIIPNAMSRLEYAAYRIAPGIVERLVFRRIRSVQK